MGIASYGIYNYSGSLRAYSINTTEVVGEADISALSASTNWDNSIAPSFSSLACVECASLHMNVNVIATTAHGDEMFWVQNVVDFANTTSQQVRNFYGLIFNETGSSANVEADSYGNGRHGELGGKATYAFGSLLNSTSSYSLPLHLRLAMSVEPYNGGIEIRMSDSPFGNGELRERQRHLRHRAHPHRKRHVCVHCGEAFALAVGRGHRRPRIV